MCSGDALTVISGMGVGWWGAAYFVSFMIMASMVMANLMVGVIISSMEMLREGFREETIVWENVRRIQRAFDIKAENIKRMLELWDLLDKNGNGFLTFDETQPMMHLINYKEVKAFEMYRRCDTNKNGQINFHEFCELVVELGNKRHDPNNIETPQELLSAAKRNHAPGILSALTGSDKRKGSMMNGITPLFGFGGKGSGRMAGRKNSVGLSGSPSAMGGSGKVYSDTNQDMNIGTTQPVDSDKDTVHKPKRQPRSSFFSSLRKSQAPSVKSAKLDTSQPLSRDPLQSPLTKSPGESPRRPKTPDKVPLFTTAMRRLSGLIIDSTQQKYATNMGDINTAEGVSSLTEDHKADDQRNTTFMHQRLEAMVPPPTKISANVDITTGHHVSHNIVRSREPSPKGGSSGQGGRLRLESLDGSTSFGLSGGQDGVSPFRLSGHSQHSDANDMEITSKISSIALTSLNVASKQTSIPENSPKSVHSRRVRVESMDHKPSTSPSLDVVDDLSDRRDLVGMEFKASKEFIAASTHK